MKIVAIVLLVLTLLSKAVSSGVRQLVKCDVIIKRVSKEAPVAVSYNSAQRSVCKKLIAACSDEGHCQVCAVAQTFRDPECAVELKFKRRLFFRTDRTMTCSTHSRVPYCRDQKIAIKIRMWKSDAKLDVLLTARDKIDKADVVVKSAAMGGMIGGIILITVVVLGLISLSCNRSNSTDHVSTTSSTAPTPTRPNTPKKGTSFSMTSTMFSGTSPQNPAQRTSSVPLIQIVTTATPIKTTLLEP